MRGGGRRARDGPAGSLGIDAALRALSRIDYVLYDPKLPLALESVEVVDVSASSASAKSGSYPVVATFRRAATTHAAETR